MKRSAFKSKAPARVARDPDRVRATPSATGEFRVPYKVSLVAAAALKKPEARRNRFLLDMAHNSPCVMRLPGICQGGVETTVAAHSNWGEHGKSGARKADDCYHVWACRKCHAWLDQGSASAVEKRNAWERGFQWMQGIWLDLVANMQPASPREKAAAQWALDCIAADAKVSRG